MWPRIHIIAVVLVTGPLAFAQSLSMHVDNRELYAGLPFVLSIEARGFEEKPEPKLSTLSIPGARVTYLGVSPNVSQMVQIINGVARQTREVAFVYRYRVEVKRAGTFNIPPITIEQGAKRAQSREARFQTREIDRSSDMQVRLVLPNRPVWVGESFDVFLDWYLSRDPGDRTFVVPLFDLPSVSVESAPSQGAKTLAFFAGSKELQLPYERGQATLDGHAYTRFRFAARVTAKEAGAISLPPARVVANLEVGQGRDFFGFPTAQHRLYKAEDVPQKLEVRALPLSGRPASFRNAVGAGFGIEVQANRTVVSVGEPVELKIAVRGKGRLDGLLLPPFDADGGLQPKLFSWPEESPAGETINEGKGKLFRVAVRLKSTEAHEIPPLSLSYFDPELGQYRTARSQPIALSVRGATMVSAKDVLRGSEEPPSAGSRTSDASHGALSTALTGVDLSLSPENRTLSRALSMAGVRPILAALYGMPLLFGAGLSLRRRTKRGRMQSSSTRVALDSLERVLDEAREQPKMVSAPRIVRALMDVARQFERSSSEYDSLLERLETEAFDPTAKNVPFLMERIDEIRTLVKGWSSPPKLHKALHVTSWMALLGSLIATGVVWASTTEGKLAAARQAYRAALAEQDRERRTQGFVNAEAQFRELAREYPDRPELLTDWGNAAIGAEELGHATIAFRRALQMAPGIERAGKNLYWVRHQLPSWIPKAATGGAADSLFFWHRILSRPERHLLGGFAFALAITLFALGVGNGRSAWLRRMGAASLIAWIVIVLSLGFEHDLSDDAVVTAEATTLRAADSIGAPAAIDKPLPPGTECTIIEAREGWTRIRLAPNGAVGWVSSATIERIGRL
jgi:hypothetical protein